MKISARRLRFLTLTSLILAAVTQAAVATTVTYFGADNGVWSTPGNWNPAAVPAVNNDVFLGSHTAGTNDLHVTFNETVPTGYASVTLNSTAINGFMIVNQTGSTSHLLTTTLNVGTTVISNTWNQSAGSVAFFTLNLGVNSASTGNSYNLSGTGNISHTALVGSTSSANIGVSGAGTFNQTGGTYDGNGGDLTLGVNVGSSGTYNLSAGTLGGVNSLQVAQSGAGLFTQTGGTNTCFSIDVGTGFSTGTYNMSGGTVDTGSSSVRSGIILGGVATGTFNLSGGTVTAPTSNGHPGVLINNAGVFNLQFGGTLKADIGLSVGGIFNLQGGVFGTAPNLTLTGGAFRLLGHSVTVDSISGTGGVVESAGGNAVLTLNLATGSASYGGTIRDGTASILSVALNGPAGLQQTLGGANTYTGSTTITTGELLAGSNTGFSSSSAFLVNGGSLKANGFNVSILSLSGTGGIVDVGNGSLTANSNNSSTTYGGQLLGTGALNKAGTGQLTLSGGGSNLNFTGNINVQGGSLRVGAVDGIASGAIVNLMGSTSLNVNFNQTLTGLTGDNQSNVNFAANSTLNINPAPASFTYAGTFTGGGTLLKSGTAGSTLVLGNGAGDTFANTDTSLAIGVQNGTLALNKADGTNAVGAAVSVSAGTLLLQRSNQIPDNSPFNISGGTFNLAGFSETIGNLSGGSGSISLGSGSLTVTQTTANTYGGGILGTGAFTKMGAADLTLTSVGAFDGGFTASTGRLVLQGPIGGTGFDALNGGTLRFTNATANLGGGTVQAFLGGNAEYLGATVSNGTLAGPGTHTVLNGGSASTFTNVTTFNSTVLTQNGAATFTNFTNGGTLNSNLAATVNRVVNTASGVINVASTLNSKDFTSSGVVNVTVGGVISNTVANFVLGGGSRTFIGTVATPGGTLTTAAGTTIELNGGLLVNNGTQTGTLNVNFGGVVKGAGVFGTVNVTDGGKFSPGNSPGTATVSGMTFASGGSYQFELNSTAATPGNGIDFINDLGSLNIAAGITSNSVFTIALITLDGANQPAPLTDFNSSLPYSFTLATAAGGITGFASNEFSVDSSAFGNNLRGGTFSVAQQGNSLVVNFDPVPEPSTSVMLLTSLGLLGLRRARSRRTK